MADNFEYDDDGKPGMVTAIAVLALALEENGVLRKDSYCGALRRLWNAMPEDEAAGEPGAMIGKLLGVIEG